MRLLLVIAAILIAAQAEEFSHYKQVDASFVERQKKILDIYNGISTNNIDSKYHHEHQEIVFNKPELFTDAHALENFMSGYKRGYIPRDGVFTLNNYKARHDTFKLFEILYFAKDFNTFIDIAKWAKNELNAMQFAYAFTVAVFNRADCRGMYVPPTYELYPHNYVPAEIMHQAHLASIHDVDKRLFYINNTGHEYSWYKDSISGTTKEGARWRGDDTESRISFFREDPVLSHWYSIFMARFATWLDPKKHTGINFVMRGKIMYSFHKWLLNRYNLERLSADMPFVTPFDWDKEVVGYNPRLVDNLGRPMISRPDHMVPSHANPSGFHYMDQIEERIATAVDTRSYWELKNNTHIPWEEKEGVDILGKILFGARDGVGRYYYKPWFFMLLQSISDMVHSTNEREFTTSAVGKYMTLPRDPLFYQVLASMDDWFQTYFHSLEPYTQEQLGFPGVKVQSVEFTKLTTFFERWDYEITKGITFKNKEDYDNKKYMVSQPRLNHKPFKFDITIESERPVDAFVRIFIGPKKNADYNDMSLNQARHAYFAMAMFPTKLKSGVNIIKKSSKEMLYYSEPESFRTFNERMTKAAADGKPFTINTLSNCEFPANLILPRGRASGLDYSIFVMVEPINRDKSYKDSTYYHCNVHQFLDQNHVAYPFDRPIPFAKNFKLPNMYFTDITIYHKEESDFNRA